MSAVLAKRRSSRQKATRKRSQYAEPDTDDDLSDNDDDFSEADLPRDLRSDSSPNKRRGIRTARNQPKTRSKSAAQVPQSTKRKRVVRKSRQRLVVGEPRKSREAPAKPTGKFTGPSDGVIPPWQELPTEILRDIFYFAAQPLEPSNVTWLCNSARICRTFMEPALEALYYEPAIWSPLHLWRLYELLSRKDRLINYNAKVKRLDVDVRRLAYTAHNRPLFNLNDILPLLPRLQHMEIIHPDDEPPYRFIKLQSWTYPDGLIESFQNSNLRLDAWRWTQDFLPKTRSREDAIAFMAEAHKTRAFEDLRELVLCGFSTDHDGTPWHPLEAVDKDTRTTLLSTTLASLKNLKDISFISCNAVQEHFLTTLPHGLQRLELSDCHEIYSQDLADFLVQCGAHLKELVLNHNSALDLAFLPGLGASCPRLEHLEMDLHYYSEHHVINLAEPLYDELLAADQIPTWPTTMRHIDLVHMQKWTAEGAINIFRSLIDGAKDLPDLRYIVLHTHISIPWRDRAGFREKWIDRLQRVFQRTGPEPDAHNNSKKQYQLFQQKMVTRDDTPPSASAYVSSVENGSAEASARRSKRNAIRPSPPIPEEPPMPAAAGSSIAEENDDHVQGLCDVVDIRVDNQRPRENQFTEQDFLDAEINGDEDWNENADDDIDDGYAW